MNRRVLGLLAVAGALSSRWALAEPLVDPALSGAEGRGAQLFAYERAQALASAKGGAASAWIVEPGEGGALLVTGLRQGAAVSRARVLGTSVTRLPDAALSPLGLRLATARDTALVEAARRRFAPCGSRPFRTVVLPADAAGTTSVYLLSQPAKRGRFPLGGHYRIDVSRDGAVPAATAYAAGCRTATWDPAQSDEALETQMAGVERVGTVAPDEMDAWVSAHLPFSYGVATGDAVWLLIGGKIGPSQVADQMGGAGGSR